MTFITDHYTCPLCASNLLTVRHEAQTSRTVNDSAHCQECTANFDIVESEIDGYRLEFLGFEEQDQAAEQMSRLLRELEHTL